jgi:hypothetical protein
MPVSSGPLGPLVSSGPTIHPNFCAQPREELVRRGYRGIVRWEWDMEIWPNGHGCGVAVTVGLAVAVNDLPVGGRLR